MCTNVVNVPTSYKNTFQDFLQQLFRNKMLMLSTTKEMNYRNNHLCIGTYFQSLPSILHTYVTIEITIQLTSLQDLLHTFLQQGTIPAAISKLILTLFGTHIDSSRYFKQDCRFVFADFQKSGFESSSFFTDDSGIHHELTAWYSEKVKTRMRIRYSQNTQIQITPIWPKIGLRFMNKVRLS